MFTTSSSLSLTDLRAETTTQHDIINSALKAGESASQRCSDAQTELLWADTAGSIELAGEAVHSLSEGRCWVAHKLSEHCFSPT